MISNLVIWRWCTLLAGRIATEPMQVSLVVWVSNIHTMALNFGCDLISDGQAVKPSVVQPHRRYRGSRTDHCTERRAEVSTACGKNDDPRRDSYSRCPQSIVSAG